MKTHDAEKWEALARSQRYFPVLSHDGVLHVAASNEATLEFFETGEADISSLLSVVTSIAGDEVSLISALDFGCGPGRLTLPLARRATAVTACDIAPTMLVQARENAHIAGLSNVTCVTNDQLMALPDGSFSFICSLLVLQYLPRAAGYDTIRSLLRLLASDGLAILHVLLAPRGEPVRQMIRVRRTRSRPDTFAAKASRAADMQLYVYDKLVVWREIAAANARILGRVPLAAGNVKGEVLIVRKGHTAS